MSSDEFAERLLEIERRLACLEGQSAQTALPNAERYWILDGLRQRYPAGAVAYAGQVMTSAGYEYVWQETRLSAAVLDQPWDGAAASLAALGHPLRLAIMRAVLAGHQTTQALQAQPDLAAAGKLYHHLRELQAAGWLTLERRGHYAVPPQKVVTLLLIVQATGSLA